MSACQKCGAPVSYVSANGEFCAYGHRQYQFKTYDQRPANTVELDVSELSEDERVALQRLGYSFAAAA